MWNWTELVSALVNYAAATGLHARLRGGASALSRDQTTYMAIDLARSRTAFKAGCAAPAAAQSSAAAAAAAKPATKDATTDAGTATGCGRKPAQINTTLHAHFRWQKNCDERSVATPIFALDVCWRNTNRSTTLRITPWAEFSRSAGWGQDASGGRLIRLRARRTEWRVAYDGHRQSQ